MKQYKLFETEDFINDLERIGDHLDQTTGDPGKTDEILFDFRSAVVDLKTFPNRFAERRDIKRGVRLRVVRQKGVILYRVDEKARVVNILRAFYGGEDFEAIFGEEPEA